MTNIALVGIAIVLVVAAIMWRFKRSAVEILLAVASLGVALVGVAYTKQQYDLQRFTALALSCDDLYPGPSAPTSDMFIISGPAGFLKPGPFSGPFRVGTRQERCTIVNTGAVPFYNIVVNFHVVEFNHGSSDCVLPRKAPPYDPANVVMEYDSSYAISSVVEPQASAKFVVANGTQNCISIHPFQTVTVRTPYQSEDHVIDVTLEGSNIWYWMEYAAPD